MQHVLIVEDDTAVRRLTARALTEEGLVCDSAVDGFEALQMLAQKRYELVVTDVLMPRHHGHALAVEVLKQKDAPMVVVLTGVAEPRIAKDLIAHGVDDVVFKPVDYRLFAAKLKACLERRNRTAASKPEADGSEPSGAGAGESAREPRAARGYSAEIEPVPLSELEQALDGDLQIPPMSSAALGVYRAARSGTDDPHALAALLRRDPPLAGTVLDLANSEVFNRSGRPIDKLERAIAVVGETRIAEVALAAGVMTMLNGCKKKSSLNTDAAWERSVAAAFFVKNLERDVSSGMFLSSFLHLAGRVVLASLFPDEYDRLLSLCGRTNQSLADVERQAFPLSQVDVLVRLAERWGIPSELIEPLRRAPEIDAWDSPRESADLQGAELIKLSAVVAPFCTGRWEPWDIVELPHPALVGRLSLPPLSQLIARTRRDLETAKMTLGLPAREASVGPKKELAYHSLVSAEADCFPEILDAMGIRAVEAQSVFDRHRTLVINTVGVEPERLSSLSGIEGPMRRRIILADAPNVERARQFGAALKLPCSMSMLQSVCGHAAAFAEAVRLGSAP